MNCQEAKTSLDAYCDGELDTTHSLEMEQHLRGCAPCSQARQNATQAARHIRAAAFAAPANLEHRLRAAILPAEQARPAALRPPRPPRSWFTWGLSTAAASFVLALILLQTVFRHSADATVLNEIADSHLRALIGDHLVDVASSDQHTVRPWFEGKVDFAPAVPDLAAHGFKIIGGRLDYINGHRAAGLVYQCRKHYISLYLWPADMKNLASRPASMESLPAQRGYQVIRWTANGMAHWAISEIGADELRDFGNSFAKEESAR